MSTAPETGAADGSSAPKVRTGLALSVIAGALALDAGSLNINNAALPTIGGRFELDNSTLQWVPTSRSITFAGFLLMSGRMLLDALSCGPVSDTASGISANGEGMMPAVRPWEESITACDASSSA
ncbi:hypothetical protein [Streptomyces sp. JNUCC 63]